MGHVGHIQNNDSQNLKIPELKEQRKGFKLRHRKLLEDKKIITAQINRMTQIIKQNQERTNERKLHNSAF